MIRLISTEHFTMERGSPTRELYLDPEQIESVESVEIRTNGYGTNSHSGSKVTTCTGQQFLVRDAPGYVYNLMRPAHLPPKGGDHG